MNIDKNKVSVIPANKEDELHRRGVWETFNENIEFFHLTSEHVPYEHHIKWWKSAFKNEYIYIILYELKVCGYVRLTKIRTDSKDKHEISIALSKEFQSSGIGSFAFQKFEKEMKSIGIDEIIAYTEFNNIVGQKFFESNDFNKRQVKYYKNI